MTSLLDMLISYLPNQHANTQYRSEKLKHKLQKLYGDLIVTQPHYDQGKASIALSPKITLDILKAAA